jgi:hypothetical protein
MAGTQRTNEARTYSTEAENHGNESGQRNL